MGKDVAISIPQPFELDIDLSSSSNINLGGSMTTKMTLDPITIRPLEVDMGLDNVNVDMGLDNVKVDMGLDKVKVDMGLDNINVCMSFAIKEFPSMRMHMPMDYSFGIKLFGMEMLGFSICGKSMIVTEDNPKRMFYTPTRKAPQREATQATDTIRVNIVDDSGKKPD